MTISREEIKKLADLARIEVSDEELINLNGEIDSVLDYVAQIQKVSVEETDLEFGSSFNVFREDQLLSQGNADREDIIGAFPNKQGSYLKVKKIL